MVECTPAQGPCRACPQVPWMCSVIDRFQLGDKITEVQHSDIPMSLWSNEFSYCPCCHSDVYRVAAPISSCPIGDCQPSSSMPGFSPPQWASSPKQTASLLQSIAQLSGIQVTTWASILLAKVNARDYIVPLLAGLLLILAWLCTVCRCRCSFTLTYQNVVVWQF